MSGEWMTLGLVGLLAAAGAASGSRNRMPSRSVRNLLLMHPDGDIAVSYLHTPTLTGWQSIRSMGIPGAKGGLGGLTLWQAVGRYGWWQKKGKWERPTDRFNKTPASYPDELGCYPPPIVIEKAVLMATGQRAMMEAAPQEALCGVDEQEAVESERFVGPPLVLYKGKTSHGEIYWASQTAEVGIGAMILCKKKGENRGRCLVWIVENGTPRVLTSRLSPHTTSIRVTGGVGVAEAMADAHRRHGLDLEPDETMHWNKKHVLKPGSFR